MICALPLMMLVPVLPGMVPTAEEIMCRVAENQQRAQAARSVYVYDMNIFIRMKRANNKLAREESREYVVAPGATGSSRKLSKVEGKIFDGRKEIPYTDPKYRYKGIDIDGELTDSFANEILWTKDSFGPGVDMFPLTPEHQKHATFRYEGEEQYREYEVYKISYEEHDDDDCWRGEALIEKHEFQPVLITTAWSCKIPGAVKVLLGTNVTQLGAKITYQRFDHGDGEAVWFPVTCGGEVRFRVLFMYARTIGFSAKNSDFRKADVQTSVEFDTDTQ